ncbi:hypothetical protein AC231_04845 [Clostridium pasteurianum]|nr:TaqI-like C-terminal specificity domain-containing protein [Clostridium pasteurianum]OMH20112.1 hypothetical protein AC231_04845 [Clostridium pasteurianum]
MNEDEPLEKEVAVDPEMLGKIFENLLDVSDRKSKGAFYTPREIVHYMCQESLINYLVNEVNVAYEDMKEFILYGELIRDADSRKNVGYSKDFTIKQSIFDNIVNIDDALKNVKVADPAVGSGAFPLGMLNEIIRARNNITEYIIRKDKEGAFGKEYGEEFIRKWRSPYKMKWDTIKNNIFAVDIEPSAVDIAKLRLWLSVVVDQEIDDENLEPHPLPNLDMNIHIGNSLIDEYEGIKLFDESILAQKDNKKGKKASGMSEQLRLFFDSDEILKEMFDKQSQYFDEANEKNKKDLKERIDELRDQLIVYKLRESGNKEALEKYNAIKHEKSKPYFIWELEFAKVFQDKGGFDIVIGNPPYVFTRDTDLSEMKNYITNNLLKGLKGNQEGKAKQSGKINLFAIFILRTVNLLKKKGHLGFIIPNTLLRATVYDVIRKFILDNTAILNIVDLGEGVFENVTASSIIIILENNYSDDNEVKITDSVISENLNIIKQQSFNNNTSYTFNIHTNSSKDDIFEKIRKNTKVLGDIVDISCGIATQGGKSKFITDCKISEKYKPLLEGKDIKEYRPEFKYKYIIYDKNLLHRARKEESFLANEKLITQRIGGGNKVLVVAYDNKQYYTFNSTNIMILKEHSNFNLKYVLAILNSKLMNWYYVQNYTNGSKLTVNISKTFLSTLPIKYTNSDFEDKIVALTDRIIVGFEKNLNFQGTVEFEDYKNQIDKFVFELYEMTPQEIKIILNNNG